MNEIEISKIMNYINAIPEPYPVKTDMTAFDICAYKRWAACEILHLLMDYPFSFPELVVENFILNMDKYLYSAESGDVQKIYAIAKETAEDILSMIS